MNWISILVGVLVLSLGIPIGNYLARKTGEELDSGRRWFKLIILISTIGTILSLIIMNDVLLFTFLLIIIVTSRSSLK